MLFSSPQGRRLRNTLPPSSPLLLPSPSLPFSSQSQAFDLFLKIQHGEDLLTWYNRNCFHLFKILENIFWEYFCVENHETSQHVNNADLRWCYIKALMDERLRLKQKLQSAVILQRHLNKRSQATSVAADFDTFPSFPGFRSVLLRAGGNTSQARRATKPWSWCQPNFWAQTASSPEPFHNACCFSQWVVTMATVVPRCRTSTSFPQFVMRRCRLPLGLFQNQ